jgi:hypothetical protein
MFDRSAWESSMSVEGQLQFAKDLRQGEIFNPFKGGSPEWYGYEYAKNSYNKREQLFEDQAGRLGV